MRNVPVQAVGYALRQAEVPCAEEIAMMLGRKYIGKYVHSTNKSPTNGTTEYYTEFYEFPLEIESELKGFSAVGETTPFSESIDIGTTLYGKYIKAKVGDFVRIRYIFPEIWSEWDNKPGGSGTGEQAYYKIYLYVRGAKISEKESVYTYVFYDGEKGSCTCYNEERTFFGITLHPILGDHTFTLIKDEEDSTIGFELSGTLLAAIDNIEIQIESYTGYMYRNAIATVKYGSYDDFTITVNERSVY